MSRPRKPTGIRTDSRQHEEDTRLAGVIEIGTTSMRLVIAQIHSDGTIKTLESLQQPVTLGKDTFLTGEISRGTSEDCVSALRNFARILREYRVSPGAVRAVATSAVREAANRDAFLDRISIATGLDVELLDEGEVNRFTYLAVRSSLDEEPALRDANVLVVEAGGGSMQALMFRAGKVSHAHTYRLGSLRLRTTGQEFGAPAQHMRDIMINQIDSVLTQIKNELPLNRATELLIFGGDARFAAGLLARDGETSPAPRSSAGPAENKQAGTACFSAKSLNALTSKVLLLSVNEAVRKYHMSYPEAETLGPAMLIHNRLCEELGLKHVRIGNATLRDGILMEIAGGTSWSGDFARQVVNSALEIGRKYNFDSVHAERTASFARQLFRAMRDEHRLGDRHETLLGVAALLHNIGLFVNNRSHHKHSMYLIMNCDIFGLSSMDLHITALVARYHRRAVPSRSHTEYAALDRENRMVVSKLAAILRIADAISGNKEDGPFEEELNISFGPGRIILAIPNSGDLTLERLNLREKGAMFQQVYGLHVEVRNAGSN